MPEKEKEILNASFFPVLKFRDESAHSLHDLVRLCDCYVGEAQLYLFNGYFEPWLVQIGEVALANYARNICASHSDSRRKGLELFVRECCKSLGMNASPILECEPSRINFGQLPIGTKKSLAVRLVNKSRGYIWGNIELRPPISAISMPASFDDCESSIIIDADLSRIEPGKYQSQLVVTIEGMPSEFLAEVLLDVSTLSLQFSPAILELGKLPFGSQLQTKVQIKIDSEGGRLLGTVKMEPPIYGLNSDSKLTGSSPEIQLSLDTSVLEAGRKYSTHLFVETNTGNFRIPVRFSITTSWKTLCAWTVGCALAGAMALGAIRAGIARIGGPLGEWFLSYSRNPSALWTGVIITGLLSGCIYLYFLRKRTKQS